MMPRPTSIARDEAAGLTITWDDGSTSSLSTIVLRQGCPCADCKMKRGDDSHSAPLSPKKSLLKVIEHTARESLTLKQIWAVGNYALGMKWADGHDSGIFTFEYLKELT